MLQHTHWKNCDSTVVINQSKLLSINKVDTFESILSWQQLTGLVHFDLSRLKHWRLVTACPHPLVSRTVRHLCQVHTRPAHAAIRGAACKLWVLSPQIGAHIPVSVARQCETFHFISLFSRCFLSVVRKPVCGWPALAARYLYDLQREKERERDATIILQVILPSLFKANFSHCAMFLSMGEMLPRSRHQFLPLLSTNEVLPDVN